MWLRLRSGTPLDPSLYELYSNQQPLQVTSTKKPSTPCVSMSCALSSDLCAPKGLGCRACPVRDVDTARLTFHKFSIHITVVVSHFVRHLTIIISYCRLVLSGNRT